MSSSSSSSNNISPRGVDASVTGFTSSLLDTLKSSQHKFDAWVQSQKDRADTAAAAHNDLVAAQRAEIDGLEAELRAIRASLGVDGGSDTTTTNGNDDNATSIAKQREQMKERQAEIERAIADLHLRQREKQRELEEMKKDEAVQRARAEEARKTKQKAEALKDQNVEDLTVGMILYKRLGLTFEKGDNGSLRFVFTMIDRNDPDRPFTFKLCVNDEALYEIKECHPPLGAGTIIRLVDELNESHDGSTDGFSTFVRGMRNAFIETI